MGILGQYALNPFSKPVRPWNATTGPDQTRGALNQLAKNLTGHDADDTIHTVTTTTTVASGVGAVTIYPAPSGQVRAVVAGSDGAGKSFQDVVAWHPSGSVTAVNSTTTQGVPAVRTYSLSTGALQLTMASGTYVIQVIPTLFT